MPSGRVVGPVDPVAVALPGLHRREVDVPHEGVDLGDLDAALGAVLVEKAQLDAFGRLREQREVGAGAVEGGPQGVRLSGPGSHEARVDVRPPNRDRDVGYWAGRR